MMHKIYYRARLASKDEYPIDQVVFVRDNGKTLTILDKLDREIDVKWDNGSTAYFNNETSAKHWVIRKLIDKESRASEAHNKARVAMSEMSLKLGFGSMFYVEAIETKVIDGCLMIDVKSLQRVLEEKK